MVTISDKKPTKNRCTGVCCAVFTLPYNPSELLKIKGMSRDPDADQIIEMVISLPDLAMVRERERRFGIPSRDFDEDTYGGRFYTCKYWDEITLKCTIYETRPRMCRDFPYGESCPHGCDHVEKNTRDGQD